MELTLLEPKALVVVVAVLVPLGGLALGRARVRAARRSLCLTSDGRRDWLGASLALASLALLLALAAAQPVLDVPREQDVRTDAEALVVLDTSRSMLAARSAASRTRFERAREAALRVRSRLADVPVGVLSLTDRLVPHLFPSPDASVFARVVERAVGIGRPPPEQGSSVRATALAALGGLPSHGFFAPGATRRVAIVLTDGETRPFVPRALGAVFSRRPRVEMLFVRLGEPTDLIFGRDGRRELAYRGDAASRDNVEAIAAAVRGRAFEEGEVDEAAAAARRLVGRGAKVAVGEERGAHALAPYAALAAFLPLLFLVRRRNF